MFTCPDLAPLSASIPPAPSPALRNFIAYALHRTRLHTSVTFAALYLLQCLKVRFPATRGSSGHRLFISAFMIASKVIQCDDTHSNKSWSIVGQGMFALREINQMEREMCSYLQWQLNIDPSALTEFEQKVRRDFRGSGPYPTYILASPAPSPVPSTTPYPQANASAPPPSFTTRVMNTPSTSPPCSPQSQRCPGRNRRAYSTSCDVCAPAPMMQRCPPCTVAAWRTRHIAPASFRHVSSLTELPSIVCRAPTLSRRH